MSIESINFMIGFVLVVIVVGLFFVINRSVFINGIKKIGIKIYKLFKSHGPVVCKNCLWYGSEEFFKTEFGISVMNKNYMIKDMSGSFHLCFAPRYTKDKEFPWNPIFGIQTEVTDYVDCKSFNTNGYCKCYEEIRR